MAGYTGEVDGGCDDVDIVNLVSVPGICWYFLLLLVACRHKLSDNGVYKYIF